MFYNYFNSNIYLIFIFLINFFMSTIFIKKLIKILKKHSSYQPIRIGVSDTCYQKSKIPTMGGFAFFSSMLINIFLFCNLHSYYTWVSLFLIISFFIIGLIDDIFKIVLKDSFGFRGSIKLILELIVGSITILFLSYIDSNYMLNSIKIPLFNKWLDLYILFVPFSVMALVGSANATNITDGMDGLLSIPVIVISLLFGIYVFTSNNFNVTMTQELSRYILTITTLLCSSFISFFMFNKYPARIFMGDIGSLTIGAILFFIAFLLKIELFYAIMALLFIIELTSTTLQSISYMIWKKPLFKMAPIHHHFEKCGFNEHKIVNSFWLFSIIMSIIGFLLLYK